MLKNHLLLILRTLQKKRGYTLINILGLALGLACCLLILLYVRHELSYDQFHTEADRIHRINWITDNPQTRTPHPMAQALVSDFPEVAQAVSITPIWGPGLTRPSFSVRYEDRQFEEPGFLAVDSTFLEVFPFPVVQGNAHEALRRPFQVVITQSVATKYFGEEDPLGKLLRINDQYEVPVGAVLADVPENSHFHFDFLLSYVTLKQAWGDSGFFEWGDFGHYNYVRLADGVEASALEAQLMSWITRYVETDADVEEWIARGFPYFQVQPITDIYLQSHLRWELEPNSDSRYVYSLSAAALFLLLIACINFMNLATARSIDRGREVGVRKALGASRLQVATQFLGESLVMSVLGMGAALVLVKTALPLLTAWTGLPLYVPDGDERTVILLMVGLTVFVGMLAGSYPALFFSAFQPTVVMKGAFKTSRRGVFLRKGLVVLQFVLSIGMMIGTLVIYHQVRFMRQAPLGFEETQVVVVPMPDSTMQAQHETIRQEIVAHPNVLQASAVSNVPGSRFNQHGFRWADDPTRRDASEWYVDYDALETLGMEMIEGRGFERGFTGDAEAAFVINEAAARQYPGDAVLGQEMIWYADADTIRGPVVGIVKDFNFASLHQPVAPMVLHLANRNVNYLLVKARTEQLDETVAFLERQWNVFAPNRTFSYSFLRDDLDALYQAEERLGTIMGLFAGLSVLVACLGLFGLAAFMAEQRTKEIGVRKVLGATVGQVVLLLTSEFTRLVLIALVLVMPVAYGVMNLWLEHFAFHTDVKWYALLFVGGGALLIAWLTVGYQAIKAALTDPATCLRYE